MYKTHLENVSVDKRKDIHADRRAERSRQIGVRDTALHSHLEKNKRSLKPMQTGKEFVRALWHVTRL